MIPTPDPTLPIHPLPTSTHLPSTMDTALWLNNTATNILHTLIAQLEIKMISDTHLMFNDRNIKHKYKNIHTQHSHLTHNIEILLNNFQDELRLKTKQLTTNKTCLTLNMQKIKSQPHLYIHDRNPNTPTLIPRTILQISNHKIIFDQLKHLQNDLVFIDTETDGTSIHNSKILSICMTTINLNTSPIHSPRNTEYFYYIKPHTNYKINTKSEAFRINKITQSDLDTLGKPLTSIYNTIYSLLTTKIVVGYNINSFDIPLIRKNLKDLKLHLPPVMTIDLYQTHHQLIKHDLNSALKNTTCYPIEFHQQHCAKADTEACIRLLAALTSKLKLPLTKESYISQFKPNIKFKTFQTQT
jgi:uncharacterized protein YprB with RNaseH-like and TPR domain